MTDGAWTYTRNTALGELLAEPHIRHIVTPPDTPRWHGKIERFHQTMQREWAHMDERLSSGRVGRPGDRLVVGLGGRRAVGGAARAEGPACSTDLGQAHMRGLVTARPLFVAGLAS